MKILVSHDVDHLYASEHFRDGILAKFAIRSTMELCLGRVRLREIGCRMRAARGRWHHIDEVMEYDERKGVCSTFFFGTANGLGMSYSLESAAPWIRLVESRGFGTGVHGIAYDDPEAIRVERERFLSVSGRRDFGIRMHYLRRTDRTSRLLAAAGYAFDATPYDPGNPRIVDGMPVFPLHIMDGRYLQAGRFGVQAPDREAVLKNTLDAVRREEAQGTKYLSLLFHDRYYSPEYETWCWWYERMIETLSSEGHSFIRYEDARTEVLSGST